MQIARNTFFMEPEHGRARAFNHGVDPIERSCVALCTLELCCVGLKLDSVARITAARELLAAQVVNEAIASCPVNCIDYVTLDDLKTLELERADQVCVSFIAGHSSLDCSPRRLARYSQQINWKARLVGGDSAANFVPPTKAASYQDGPQGKCADCPNRGCKTCPMFGVGENPVFMRMLKEREQRRNNSGFNAAVRKAKERDAMLDLLNESQQPMPEVGEIPTDDATPPSQSSGAQPPPTSEAWQEQEVTQVEQTAVTFKVEMKSKVVLDEATVWNALFATSSSVQEGDPVASEGAPYEEEQPAADT
eukprot:6196500-Pleurochrysis_carterae.AAC.1